MNAALPICLSLILFMAVMILPAYAITGLFDPVTFTGMNYIKALGNYTFDVTLTDLLKDGNNDEIRGELGYGFKLINNDNGEKEFFLVNFSVRPDNLPQTFTVNVSFTEPGHFFVTEYYKFFKINHYMYDTTYPKGGTTFNSFKIVGEYGRAADVSGICNNKEMHRVIRPDFSSLVCVRESTHEKLLERGWHM